MPMAATKTPYTLFIVEDEDSINPREDWDCFGKMICFHSRYNLGDKHDYEEPRDFLQGILFDKYSSYPDSQYGKPVYDYIRQGRAKEAKLEYNRSSREWELLENNYWSSGKDWYVSSNYPANLKGKDVPDWFLDNALSSLRMNELLELVREMENMVILPLYLYDHSGITMNTSGFSCPWDSGQVGWIYADEEAIKKEYGEVTPETIKQAETVLQDEVKSYDYYLTGQCYGFQLFEGEEEIDSCWGFLGEIRDVQDAVKDYLPDECKDIVESLQYRYESLDIEDYLEESQDLEDECDVEL